jgi:hypothetical protein
MSASVIDYGRLSLSLRWEFRRHHFSERERLVLDWMLDCSLVCGHDEMLAQTLDSIGELAHISRGNVHTILEDLKGMGVIASAEADGVTRYRINTRSHEWKCRERLKMASLKVAMANIRATNGLDTNFFVRANTPTNGQPPPPIESYFTPAVSEPETVSKSTP